MFERRKTKRFVLPLPLSVDIRPKPLKQTELTHLNDISVGGACFDLKNKVAVGSMLNLQITDIDLAFFSHLGFPDKESDKGINIGIQGKVLRWNQSSDAGDVAVIFTSPMRITKRADSDLH